MCVFWLAVDYYGVGDFFLYFDLGDCDLSLDDSAVGGFESSFACGFDAQSFELFARYDRVYCSRVGKQFEFSFDLYFDVSHGSFTRV